ncbi:tRNA-specific adenosine-34 deaminase subunit Tad3 [Aspergillus nomiae NRRL 13137]|uniref:tRNA-specific adenosine-34 deaminase subunit Tad3 n=1 Tax=Aspergillus nomiae NRRL (strain ATCC 15546 / NRRL 13137 / CBS 260.88 / M93) TaxID=1509407 RepID=A0A0L1J7J5_ASPN3|nr:tRNA-specific adenosine-34 deaminase subunit Tad3 [Aspergillus nomiae NRRL 13137]KNG87724.1 tRNA-specific adenosine-34 deaminase subunit Tad3 [Aspergillus nomiae NRRL 13137]
MYDSMYVQELLRGVEPLSGQVIPVKTVQEARPREEFADAYVVEVGVKSASKVIKALDSAFPRDPSRPLSHLRRFAKHTQLPDDLRSTLIKGEPSAQTIFTLIPPPLPEAEILEKLLAPFAPPSETPSESSQDVGKIELQIIRIPLEPPLTVAQAENWTKTMWPVTFNPAAPRATIAPPLQTLNRVLNSIKPKAGRYLALARKVADEAENSGHGRRVGAVVVDPELEAHIGAIDEDVGIHWADAIVAVAGDVRYARREAGAMSESERQLGAGPNPNAQTYNSDVEGGPELHALMRAADLIASGRRKQDGNESNEQLPLNQLEKFFLSQSDVSGSEVLADSDDLSPVPGKYQKTDTGAIPKPIDSSREPRLRSRAQGGYLCTDLDVYLTHEPCICCSMGLLLSRFRAVIFPRQGRMITGGLASEPVISPVPVSDPVDEAHETPEITQDQDQHESEENTSTEHADPQPQRMYYGLHWRKELNWRALGFEFVEDGVTEKSAEEGLAFHA